MKYDKGFLSIEEQIAQLEQRGLEIADKAYAERVLLNVGYYRLAGYWWPLQENRSAHTFLPGVSFHQAIQIYKFDREFRQLCFHLLERIEVAVRTKMKHYPSEEFGPWWFEEASLFRNQYHFQNNLDHIEREVKRSKEVFIEHHFDKYTSDTRLPPAWKSLEVISFGTLSKLYKSLSKGTCRKTIAKDLGFVSKPYLESWLQSMTIIRNICAHHSRLWNRRLQHIPKLLNVDQPDWVADVGHDPHRMYIMFCGMVYMLRHITEDRSIDGQIRELFEKYPTIDPTALGFPKNWTSDRFWKQ